MKPKYTAARAAFRAGHPYTEAADILSVIAAKARARYFLKFRTAVAEEDYFSRARDAALEAAASWKPRDRRAGFDLFRQHVFDAVDYALGQHIAAQGIATVKRRNEKINPSTGKEDRRNNPPPAFDIATAVVTATAHLVEDSTLRAFAAKYPREHKLATALQPYTAVALSRYVQQARPAKGYTDADRDKFRQEVQDACTLLRMFADSRVVASGLEFEGLSPTLAHHVLHGLAFLSLPGRPPRADELKGPFWKPTPGLPGELVRVEEKDDGALQPYAREYLLKLRTWAGALSAAMLEESQRGQIAAATLERVTGSLREAIAARARWEESEIGQAARAVDARKAGLKSLKRKRPTRKL